MIQINAVNADAWLACSAMKAGGRRGRNRSDLPSTVGATFTTDAVPSEVIDNLVSAAVQAPSAMNLQPWAFLTIVGRVTLSQYSERAKRHLLETMTPDSPIFHYRDRLSEPAFDIFYGASVLVVIAATSDAAQSAEDCCLAAQNLMLAAHGMGLGTCCICFARPWLNLAETKAELGIPRLTPDHPGRGRVSKIRRAACLPQAAGDSANSRQR
jgi:nitroreductase